VTDLETAACQAAKGDGQAFEAVCRALQDDVWRYCYALIGDRDLASEAAQETFLRSVRAIRGFRGDAPVRAWFLSLARRSAGAVLRKARREPAVAAGGLPEESSPGPALEAQLLVDQLPAELRQAFVLTQVLGLSYAAASEVMGCPVGTIRSRVFRARARLVAAWTGDASVRQVEEGGDVDG
jgi:RNA polymerase sigma-70 factor (ECF subfamily)